MAEIQHYYEDYAVREYDELLFRDGFTLQGRELNNLQKQAASHIEGIAGALFKDGDVIRDAQIAVNPVTGEVNAQSGAVYLKGRVRGVPPAQFTIPTSGLAVVGIYLTEAVVSEQEDPSLYNPAKGSRGEGEAGAWRRRVEPHWGFSGDATPGEFYPVHTVEDGVPRAKDTPPSLDSFNQAIAKYDRDSTGGGSYVVSGLEVAQAPDAEDGKQVYTISEGRARVNGHNLEFSTSRRLTYAAHPDLRPVDTEVHISSGIARQRVDVARTPVGDFTGLRVTLERTVEIIHGSYVGASDDLPDTSVTEIIECRQGETVFQKDADYKRTGDRVDWSPSGAEPNPGTTYSVTYQYIAQVQPEAPDSNGFYISGAVVGSSILVSYNQMLPRYDRLAVSQDGEFVWISGVGSDRTPRSPDVPPSLLPIATVYQAWTAERQVVSDGVRVVPFSDIAAMNERIDLVVQEVARQRLEADISTREAGARKGIFVDPLLDDNNRDQGIEQNAAIVEGLLTLPIKAEVLELSADVVKPTANSYSVSIVLNQPLRTGSMQVNPYMAFDPIPAQVVLRPALDQWTESATNWSSPITQRLTIGHGNRSIVSTKTSTQTVSVTSTAIEHLREIDVAFTLNGFGPGETLDRVTFDGVEVTPRA